MTLHLPSPLAAYFAAENGNDPEALSQCFVGHAIVHDEGRTIEGPSAIKQWMERAKAKYQHTVEPLAVAERGGKTIVTATVSGNFPGSPINLEHIFGFEGGKIVSLEIR
jgi:hypothetical protein